MIHKKPITFIINCYANSHYANAFEVLVRVTCYFGPITTRDCNQFVACVLCIIFQYPNGM